MGTTSILARAGNRFTAAASVMAIVALAGLTGCAPDGSDVPVASAPATVGGDGAGAVVAAVTNAPMVTTTGVTVNVIAIDNNFRAQDTTAAVGDTVVFTNKGKNDHNVVPRTGNDWGVQIAGFHPGDVYRYVFTAPGVYAYFCSIHGTNQKAMVGTITVSG